MREGGGIESSHNVVVDNGNNICIQLRPNHHSVTGQRLLISPTDFLTLTEDCPSRKNSAVKKDVNLSTGSLQTTSQHETNSNFSINLERYCESPILLDAHKDSHLICDDETSCNGRSSRLSESNDDIAADDVLFATTLDGQHHSLREVVTPTIDNDSSRAGSPSIAKDVVIACSEMKDENDDETNATESSSQQSTQDEINAMLNASVVDGNESVANIITSSSASSLSTRTIPLAFYAANNNTVAGSSTSSTTTTTQPLSFSAIDIKVLAPSVLMKDSVLLANLAAALPSSFSSRQIALQIIREDGTSLVVPIKSTEPETTAKSGSESESFSSEKNSNMVLTEVVSPNETMRPFKCEL